VRIVSIQLKNIKSHRDTELTFAPGINVLCGANGSGKSTIFEAIGYALFGVSAQDFVSKAERFLSIGSKKGEVAVVFEAADGETYRVTRTVGSAGKWLLAKESHGSFEIEEHANIGETETRIAALLGLSRTRSLADQFKLVIGPFQNDFLGPFVIRQPTKRQDAFDEILGIDAWRKTFDGTKALISTIAGKIETLQAEVAGKQEQVAALPAKELELAGIRSSAEIKQKELSSGSAALERVTGQLALWDAHKEKLDAAQNAVQLLQDRVKSGNEYVANQQFQVQQATEAAAVLETVRPGKLAYDAADGRLKGLRDEQQRKSLVEKELATLEKDHSGTAAALDIENRELKDLADAIEVAEKTLIVDETALAAALTQSKEAQLTAQAALDQVNSCQLRFRELPAHRIDNELAYLTVALDRMVILDGQLAEKAKAVAGISELQARSGLLGERQGALEAVQHEKSLLAGRRQALVEGREKIGAGDCPFFQEPCQNLADGCGVDVFSARIDQADAEIARLDDEAQAHSVQLKEARDASLELAGLEQVARELEQGRREREGLALEFAAKLKELDPAKSLTSLETFLAQAGLPEVAVGGLELDLSEAPEQRRQQLQVWSDCWNAVLSSIEQVLTSRVKQAEQPVHSCVLKLQELAIHGDALARKKRDLLADREKLLQRRQAIEAHQVRLAALQGSLDLKKQALALFAGIEDRIEQAGAELARYQEDRDRYIAHEQAALDLAPRQEKLAKYRNHLQSLESDLAAKAQELSLLQEGYQAAAHEEMRGERERLMSAQATLQAELAGLADGVTRLEGEIVALRGIAREIERKLADIEELREQGNLVKFLRTQLFKNVSSQLSERFREEISFRADRIYRSIAESDEELYWGENYQIVLKDMADGVLRERSDDQLSGGQMMSAVVALRLALLQTIGARIAFFDEPTSNLDAERRENLARAFRAIDVGKEEVTEHWYDQLFLVSHDVSFTEITDQMIQLDDPK
jgi:DNA repair protein SbcC/Rad50